MVCRSSVVLGEGLEGGTITEWIKRKAILSSTAWDANNTAAHWGRSEIQNRATKLYTNNLKNTLGHSFLNQKNNLSENVFKAQETTKKKKRKNPHNPLGH